MAFASVEEDAGVGIGSGKGHGFTVCTEFIGTIGLNVPDGGVVVWGRLDFPIEDEGVVGELFFGPQVFFAGGFAEGVVVDFSAGGFPVVVVALRDAPTAKIGSCEERVESDVGVMGFGFWGACRWQFFDEEVFEVALASLAFE